MGHEVHIVPSILINGKTYYGKVTCPEPTDIGTCPVLGAVCDGFPSEPILNRPAFCDAKYCWGPMDRCVVCNGNSTTCGEALAPASVTLILTMAAASALAAIFLVICVMHRLAKSREEGMRQEFEKTLAKYAPIGETLGR